MDFTYDEIRNTLGLAEGGTTVQIYHRFDFQKSNSPSREKPTVIPEWFLWNWQDEARDYLRKRKFYRSADIRQIDSWISDLSQPSSRISRREAAKWAAKINGARK